MIFSGDCGLTAPVDAWQALTFRLRVGHFSRVAIRPLLGAKGAVRWLSVGWGLAGTCGSPDLMKRLLLPHDEGSHSSRGLFGESRYHVGVDVESNGDGGMA